MPCRLTAAKLLGAFAHLRKMACLAAFVLACIFPEQGKGCRTSEVQLAACVYNTEDGEFQVSITHQGHEQAEMGLALTGKGR